MEPLLNDVQKDELVRILWANGLIKIHPRGYRGNMGRRTTSEQAPPLLPMAVRWLKGISGSEASQINHEVAMRIARFCEPYVQSLSGVDIVVGVPNSGCLLATAVQYVCPQLNLLHLNKSDVESGMGFALPPKTTPDCVEDKVVLFVDNATSTGDSIARAIKYCMALGIRRAVALSVIDWTEGGASQVINLTGAKHFWLLGGVDVAKHLKRHKHVAAAQRLELFATAMRTWIEMHMVGDVT